MKLKFKKANDDQLKVILSTEGPLLVIAGPGTGKTYTLINRALNLIVNKKISPSNILFSTFTDKAANELITRLSNALNENNIEFNPNEMYLGTFHSICLKILKENIAYTSLKKNFNLKDQFDQQYFIYQHFSDFKAIENFDNYISTRSFWDKCESILKYVNRLNEELIDYEELLKSDNPTYIFFGKLIQTYESLRIENNFLDFSSIQVETYKMLKAYPEVANKIINSIDYVMIDEYQDTNHIQEKLAMFFGSKRNNICVVGDDDQAIYRFRGATVRNILEFPKHFDNCKKIALIKNYRSNKDIVKFYNKWMDSTDGRGFDFDWGKYRYEKKIVAVRTDKYVETAVIQCSTKEKDYINEKTLLTINKLIDSGKIKDLNQIAFLFRSVKNESVKSLADYLEKNEIPVYSPRSNLFFDRHETKLILGSLIFMFPKYATKVQKNEESKEMNFYYQSCLMEAKDELSKPEYKNFFNWMRFRTKDHMFMSKSLDYSFSGLLYQMLEFEPFRSLLSVDLTKNITDTRISRNVGLLIKLLVKFEYLNNVSVLTKLNIDKMVERLFNQYIRFLYEGGITEYEDESEYAPSGCVSFLTIHQSKGLEFPIVFVGSQSSTPRKQYIEDIEDIISRYSGRGPFEEIEMMKMFDFWRLYYVAFSRAQSLLIMLCDASKSNEPSKYFEYIYNYLPYEVNFTNFDFEDIKNTDIKNAYSFTSDINAYLICPTQYKYFKELGFEPVRIGSTLFGTIVHETIEDIHKAVVKGEIDTVTDDNISKWLEINYKTASKLNNYYLNETSIKSAFDQVMSYVARASENWDIIKDAELPISLSQKKYILNGKVDLILNDKGQYEVLDFKTEKKPILNKEIDKVERVKRQLEIYAYLIEKKYDVKVSGMKVYYTSEIAGNPYLSFKKDDTQIKETIKILDDVVDKIENKKFEERCSDLKICKNCDLRFYCKRR
ncbi:MAG: ATP-dependent helicase [Bacilli bacterium]